VPFTVSHVAAVLPGARTRIPMAALVVGAMSPDIPYFLPRGPWALPTHTLGGVLLWAPLLGLVVLLVWDVLLARAAYAFAPEQLRRRLPRRITAAERYGSLRSIALVYAGLAIGAATHVLWDAFTHDNGWVVVRVPALLETIAWLPRELAAYKWLQYLSSVIGLAILLWWIARWWRATPPSPVPVPGGVSTAARWTVIGLVAVTAVGAGLAVNRSYLIGESVLNLRLAVFRAITVGSAYAALVMLAAALVWTLAQLRRSRA